MNTYHYPEERIAVVGMGGLFPDAGSVDAFWNNILQKKVSVREIPPQRLDQKIYYRPEVLGKADKGDKTYTKIGAIVEVENYLALCRKYRIPPAVAQHMDPNQHTAIYCVDQALESLRSELPKSRTAVILGTGGQGKSYENIVRRTFYPRARARVAEYLEKFPGMDPGELERFLRELDKAALQGTIPITEDSAPGELQNITAARITNLFDFWGPSFTVDAACASALAAVSLSMAGLLRREYDVVITGGVEVTLDEIGLILYSGINALSPDGSFPFDERANGFVMGLGGGIIILKRLEDALRDQDRILALLSGYGQGSDGKGKYIAAPNEDGQARVIQKACEMAGYPADTIEFIETHGTGTSVGDVVEVNALKKAFQAQGVTRQNFCGLGSLKSNIGHLRYASGAASLIKASLALHQKTLPPTAGIQKINPKLELEGSPFYILTEVKPWLEPKSHPRRANISAYGFGGSDYHITLEEFRPEFYRKIHGSAPMNESCHEAGPRQMTLALEKSPTGSEIVFFSGDSLAELKKSYQGLVEAPLDSLDYHEFVSLHNSAVTARKEWRLAICAGSKAELAKKWAVFEQNAKKSIVENTLELKRKGIYLGHGEIPASDQIAWMFPGQASQYPNMLKSLRDNYPGVESLHFQMDTLWKARYGYPVTPLIYGNDEKALEQELKNTKNTHPAMFVSNISIYKLLTDSGVQADFMIGHSLGEITALFAAGMLDLKSAIHLIGARGFSFDGISGAKCGAMISVKADQAQVLQLIRDSGLDLHISNINSPEQTVVGGEADKIKRFGELLTKRKMTNVILKTSHAFHTPLTQEAAASFAGEISGLKFGRPKGTRVMACHRVDFYPETRDGLLNLPDVLKEQIISPVNFADSIRKLYDLGVRVFIETGPGAVLTNLVKSILADTDVKVVAANNKSQDALEAYYYAMAELFSYGLEINIPPSLHALKFNESTGASADQLVASTGELGLENPEKAIIKAEPSPPAAKESIVYSGVSMGLPGSFKKIFADDNFRLLLEGKNLIEMLTDDEMSQLADLNITRLVKTEGGTTFKKLSAWNEVIQLMGKYGQLDMVNDYLLDEKLLEEMTFTVCAGVAAGYEALKDAGIPLVREYIKTASGARLPGRLLLPEEMREDTGIIFANGLFPIEMVIGELSKYLASKFGGKTRRDLLDFYEAVIGKVSDPSVKKLLSDWFAMHHSRLLRNGGPLPNDGTAGIYEFNHRFITLLYSQSNNRMAQLIGATGPNFFLSAACASTTSAVTVAEDMIRAGHARRMIVIGADSSSSPDVLPWIGAGFLSIGAASDSANVFEAAVPFDKRRNGMILGAGAVGLVIEKEIDVAARGMNGLCRILGTHAFNAAGHQSKIDSAKYGIELDKFLTKMEKEYSLERRDIASRMVYYSHETYSARQGGCSYTEKTALEKAFGSKFRELKVINTKGMTGHPMGASLEEAVAAKALQFQRIPPIVNYKVPDPDLEGLNLSQGGSYHFEYVLRMVSGFGSQGAYHLLQRIASGENRIINRNTYQEWLERITTTSTPSLKNYGRLLVAEGATGSAGFAGNEPEPETPIGASHKVASWNSSVTDEILAIYAEVTQYPKEMLDLSMELEADLGIDTVKQATIFGMIAEKFNLQAAENLQLSSYPTIGHLVDFIQSRVGIPGNQPETLSDMNSGPVNRASGDDAGEVFRVISEITQYPVEMLEPAMEMEADLGIDTVKQATIFAILGEKFGVPERDTVNVSQYRTIGSVVEFIRQKRQSETGNQVAVSQPKAPQPTDAALGTQGATPGFNQQEFASTRRSNTGADIEAQVLEVIGEITKYPVEMLEKEMEMEADLGIDTVKQATIMAILSDKFELGEKPNLNISQYTTIASLIGMVQEAGKIGASATPVVQPEAQRISEPAEAAGAAGAAGAVPEVRELCLQMPTPVTEKIGAKDFDLRDKNIWILGDRPETVHQAQKYFQKWSGRLAVLIFEDYPAVSDLETRVAVLAKEPVDVIFDCAHLNASIDFDEISSQETVKMLFLNGTARFVFYKKLLEYFPEPEIRIVCAVSMDGCHGYGKGNTSLTDPFYGALSGVYKALGKEWPKSRVKIVDLGPMETNRLTDQRLAKIADELQVSSPDYEIGYTGGKRWVLKIDDIDQASFQTVTLPEQAHFVMTGGGYGITAEIILGLSRAKNAKFTILGRTELPANIAELARLDDQGLEQHKLAIHRTLQASGQKITPVMVQSEFEKSLKAISIFKLINQVEQNGSRAAYFPCDVTDFDSLEKSLAKAVASFGPVQVLVHAAGMEKSKLLSQKSQDEFMEIFAVKTVGLCNLYRLVDRKELKALIGFSSISGRFGNEAQIDYCSANSFINSFIAVVKRSHPNIHALSIAWSGWKDTGMAWRNEFVKTHAEEMGIHLIEPKRGTAEFIRVLNQRWDTSEIIISKGLHRFIDHRMLKENSHETPLIDWIIKNDGKPVKAFKVLSVKRDPIIDHHRLGTIPLMPAVGFMEICAEVHSLTYGLKEQYCFRNIELTNPLKLFHEKAQEVMAEIRPQAAPESFEAVFTTVLESKYGVTKSIDLNRMQVSAVLGEYLSLLEMKELEKEPMETGFIRQSLDEYYRKFGNVIQLGTIFMDEAIENNTYRRNRGGVVYSVILPQEQLVNTKYRLEKILLNPAFMDTVFQACGIHSVIENDRVYLPWKVEEFGVVKVPRERSRYKAYAKVKADGDGLKTYDVIMVNERDEVCYYAKNVIMRLINL